MSKSQTSVTLDAICAEWKGIVSIPKTKNLKVYSVDNDMCILTGSGIKIAKTKSGRHLPLLTEIDVLEKFPHVIVDMGAVRFVCKGANLMRPGITQFGKFEKGDIVCIREESRGKYLAVGEALISSEESLSAQRGMVLENLHYISDKIWEAAKGIRD